MMRSFSSRIPLAAFCAALFCFAIAFSGGRAHAQSAPWRAFDIATSPSNETRLLWRTPDNGFQVWNIGDGGARQQTSPVFGPINDNGQAWSPVKLGVDGAGITRLLLSRSDGAGSIWSLDGSLNFAASSPAYGPYAGWTPVDMAVARDGSQRLLWKNSNGSCAVWSISTGGFVSSSPAFGPYSEGSLSWSASKIAVGGDGLVRVLWNRSDKQGALWLLDEKLNFASSSPGYGPSAEWDMTTVALDTSAASDNKRRVLWKNVNKAAAFWKLSPDNTTLEANATHGPYPGWEVRTISVGGDGQTRALWNNSDGRAAFWKMAPDGQSLQVNVTFGPLPDVGPPPPLSGKIVFISIVTSNYGGQNFEVFVANANGTNKKQVTFDSRFGKTEPQWSPDGSKILYSADTETLGGDFSRVFTINADGSGQTNLTQDGGNNIQPQWSPDGSKIAFTSSITGNYEVFVMNADGSGKTNLSQRAGSDSQPQWSPDGKRIVWAADYRLFVMNADGTGKSLVTPSGVYCSEPQWSPTGRKILFCGATGGKGQVSVINADGTGFVALTANGADNYSPQWSPDGSRIVWNFASYSENDYPQYQSFIMVMNADGSGQVAVRNSSRGHWPQWSPDGSRVVWASHEIFLAPPNSNDLVNVSNTAGEDSYPQWTTGSVAASSSSTSAATSSSKETTKTPSAPSS